MYLVYFLPFLFKINSTSSTSSLVGVRSGTGVGVGTKNWSEVATMINLIHFIRVLRKITIVLAVFVQYANERGAYTNLTVYRTL